MRIPGSAHCHEDLIISFQTLLALTLFETIGVELLIGHLCSYSASLSTACKNSSVRHTETFAPVTFVKSFL